MKEKTQWTLPKETETPFDTLKQFDRIVGEQCRENKTWRTIAVISISAFFLSLGIMIWTVIKDASEKKYIPIIVSVNDIGEATYHGAVDKINYKNSNVSEDMIQFQIKSFIENAFTIPKDGKILKQNLTKCYSNLTQNSANKFTKEIQTESLEKFGKYLRSVKIESLIKVSDKSYQIDYFLNESSTDNLSNTVTKLRTVATVEIQEPIEADKKKNPLGIYITDFGTSILQVK